MRQQVATNIAVSGAPSVVVNPCMCWLSCSALYVQSLQCSCVVLGRTSVCEKRLFVWRWAHMNSQEEWLCSERTGWKEQPSAGLSRPDSWRLCTGVSSFRHAVSDRRRPTRRRQCASSTTGAPRPCVRARRRRWRGARPCSTPPCRCVPFVLRKGRPRVVRG